MDTPPQRRTRPVLVSHWEPDEPTLLARHVYDEENICPLCSESRRPETVPWVTERAQKAIDEWNLPTAP